MKPPPYDTDLTDEQYALVEPFLPRPKPMGRPRPTCAVLHAIPYLARTGCPWRMLPHDSPPPGARPTPGTAAGGRTAPGADPPGAAAAGPPPSQSPPQPAPLGRRQPVGQGDAPRRGEGLRQREE